MTTVRTILTAALLGLAAAPALAESFAFDLPRLDFPTAPAATRACTDLTSPAPCGAAG